MGSYNIEVDPTNNRMELKLAGQLDESELAEVVDAVAEGAAQLDDGWGLINDISSYKPATENAEERLKEGAKKAGQLGMGTVVRVTGESITAEFQWERVGEEAASETGYEIFQAETVEDAAAVLDEHQ
ncbi:hypothetical protein [Halorhabdus amylolytica]|uniref:hypothetical protein n=1 Tax=Halorhabdus amylolytica TaxID=2559573 RepID=UPI0010AB0676|nr:hypothetical protein [Halorhabdus amylolytica]